MNPSSAADKNEYTPMEEIIDGTEVPLCDDGGVTKETIRQGRGRSPPNGSKVFVHFVGTIVEGEPGKGSKPVVFLQTKETSSPFTFNIGQEQTIRGLEVAVGHMKEGEVAVIICKPEYAFGSFGNPQGFHSMGKPIPPNATLRFEIELISFEVEESVEPWKADDKTRIENAQKNKDSGNDMFKQRNYEKACLMYRKAVDFLLSCDDKKSSQELLLTCYLNIASCRLKTNEPKEVIEAATKALEIDCNNVKALFRRGKGYNMKNDSELAKQDLTTALQLDKSNNEVRQELGIALQNLNISKQKEKKIYGGMFSKLNEQQHDGGSLYEDRVPEPEPKTRKCNICGEVLETAQWARHVIKKHGAPKDQ